MKQYREFEKNYEQEEHESLRTDDFREFHKELKRTGMEDLDIITLWLRQEKPYGSE